MAEQKTSGAATLIAVPLMLLAAGFLLIILILPPGETAAAACTGAATTVDPATPPQGAIEGYEGDQLVNAAHIMNAASTLKLDRNAQVLGVMTAIGESSLTVLDNGDAVGPDSRGLFQQRDNGAWGTYEDRMNPSVSATNFFTALTAVTGWETLEPTLAAHMVQGNADPFHYERFFTTADRIVTALAGDGPSGAGCASGSVVLPLSAGFNMTDGFGPRISPVAGASSWHPATDLQHYPNPCGDQIYSISAGTVALIQGYQVSIKAADGYTVTYMHMKLSDVSVQVGDPVTAGQPIALVGNEGPSTGCHLDIRIDQNGSTNDAVTQLSDGEDAGGPAASRGYVNPEEFFALYGIELCPTSSCQRQLS